MTNAVDATCAVETSRHFDASPERVFDAWLGTEWGDWLPPAGARCNVVAIEPKVGGTFQVDMTMSDGRKLAITGVYREVVRPETLVFTWVVASMPSMLIATRRMPASAILWATGSSINVPLVASATVKPQSRACCAIW